MKKFLTIFLMLFISLTAVYAENESAKTDDKEETEAASEIKKPEVKQQTDYKKETKTAKRQGGKAQNHGSVSAGYEHTRSKYQAQKSMNKYKPAFERRRDYEILLIRGKTPSPNLEKEVMKDMTED